MVNNRRLIFKRNRKAKKLQAVINFGQTKNKSKSSKPVQIASAAPKQARNNKPHCYEGTVAEVFVAFGYIASDDLAANVFFVPSPSSTCQRFCAGAQVKFTAEEQLEENGCRWIATKVWLTEEDKKENTDSPTSCLSEPIVSDYVTPNRFDMQIAQKPLVSRRQHLIGRVLSLDSFTDVSSLSDEIEFDQYPTEIKSPQSFEVSLFTCPTPPPVFSGLLDRKICLQEYNLFGAYSQDFLMRAGHNNQWDGRPLDYWATSFRHDADWMVHMKEIWTEENNADEECRNRTCRRTCTSNRPMF